MLYASRDRVRWWVDDGKNAPARGGSLQAAQREDAEAARAVRAPPLPRLDAAALRGLRARAAAAAAAALMCVAAYHRVGGGRGGLGARL
eukprot:COSAG06_NODE_3090_length_5874_cov_116.796710_2_plen_89_part_00